MNRPASGQALSSRERRALLAFTPEELAELAVVDREIGKEIQAERRMCCNLRNPTAKNRKTHREICKAYYYSNREKILEKKRARDAARREKARTHQPTPQEPSQ